MALFFALRGPAPVGLREPCLPSDASALRDVPAGPHQPPGGRLAGGRAHAHRRAGSHAAAAGPLYLDPFGRSTSISGSLLDDTGRGDLLTLAEVSNRVIPEALRDLDLHGIDHRLLFPDMYGAAAHANARLELEEMLEPPAARPR